MVPASPAADDHPDPPWLARVLRLVELNRGAFVIGLEGGHDYAAEPLVRALMGVDDSLCVCLGPRELPTTPTGSLIVLLGAAQDATWLNLARPVVTERELRVFVWLEAGDRSVLRDAATDFLDWMRQTVDIPPGTPRYAIEALRGGIARGEWIAWLGPGVEAHLPPDVPVVRRADDTAALVDVMRRGVVLAYGILDARFLKRLIDAYMDAGRGAAVIMFEPACVTDQTVVVHATPRPWRDAAERFSKAGSPNPGLAAALTGLDPGRIARTLGETLPDLPRLHSSFEADDAPTVIHSTRQDRPSMGVGTEPDWSRVFSRLIDGSIPLAPHLRVERPAMDGIVADVIQSHAEPVIHLLTGWKGSGRSTEMHALAHSLTQSGFVALPVPFSISAEHSLVGSIGHALIEEATRALGHSRGRSASHLLSLLALPPERVRAVQYVEAFIDAANVLLEDLARVYGRPVALLIDSLGFLSQHATAEPALAHLSRLACSVVAGAPRSLVWNLTDLTGIRTADLSDLPVTPFMPPEQLCQGVGFFLELLRRRLDDLEERGVASPGALRDEAQMSRLAIGSGGRPAQFLRLVRGLVLLLTTDPGSALSEVIGQVLWRERNDHSMLMTRREAEALDAAAREPRQRPASDHQTARLLDLGLLYEHRDTEGWWYAPNPLLHPARLA